MKEEDVKYCLAIIYDVEDNYLKHADENILQNVEILKEILEEELNKE